MVGSEIPLRIPQSLKTHTFKELKIIDKNQQITFLLPDSEE
jgi:hypothetical protein